MDAHYVYDSGGPNINAVNVDFSVWNATLIIDWMDGSGLEIIQNYQNNEVITHTYSSQLTGNVNPVTRLQVDVPGVGIVEVWDGINIQAGYVYEFNLDVACTQGEDAKWKHTESGNWRLRSKIWINNNIFGKHAGSYTEAYEKAGGNWKAKKATIKTTISADFRDEDCSNLDPKQGSKSKNAKTVNKSKTVLFQKRWSLSNGDVQSTHQLKKGGITINASMVLNPC